MNSSATKQSSFHNELPPPYRIAVESILREDVPRITSELASRLVPPTRASVADPRKPVRWLMPVASLACAAAAILVACVLLMRPASAWAQIANAVARQPWVKLEMSVPERQDKAEFWLSPTKRTASSRFPGSAFLMDLERSEAWRYVESERTVYIGDPTVMDYEEYLLFDSVLEAISNGRASLHSERSTIKLLSQSSRPGSKGDQRWTEYLLEYEDARRTVPRFTRSFSVPVGATLPDKMTEEIKHDGKTIAKVYQLSYPQDGPVDLAALGVPNDAKVVDTRSGDELKKVLATYAEKQSVRMEPHSAVVLRTSQNWKSLTEAFRVRLAGTNRNAEVVDFEQLMKFQMGRADATGNVLPDGVDGVTWWKEQVDQMSFASFGDKDTFGSGYGMEVCPDRVGYPGLGLPNEGLKATFSPKPFTGPSDTVMISVEDAKSGSVVGRYWLAPDRGYLCVRSEMPDPGTGWIATVIIDSTEKSPKGHWYATQVRTGRIERSGDEHRAEVEVAPVATSLYRYLVEFEETKR